MSTPSDNGIPMLTEVIKPDAHPVAATSATAPVPRPQAAAPLPRPTTGATPVAPAAAPATAPATAAASPLPPASILKTSPFAPPPPAATPAAMPDAPPKPAMPGTATASAPPAKPSSPAGLTTTPGGAEINTAGVMPTDEWQRLENEIRQRIARQVLERIDFVLDHRIRSSVATVVDQAVDGLASDIKRGLHETLEDIVTRAVAQEIARISPLKK